MTTLDLILILLKLAQVPVQEIKYKNQNQLILYNITPRKLQQHKDALITKNRNIIHNELPSSMTSQTGLQQPLFYSKPSTPHLSTLSHNSPPKLAPNKAAPVNSRIPRSTLSHL